MENPTRRRVLAAGLAGTALGLIGGRAASAGTAPPAEPTDAATDDATRDRAASADGRGHRAARVRPVASS